MQQLRESWLTVALERAYSTSSLEPDIKAPVGFAGLAIGLVLTLIHLVGIPITNTSVTPERSIGPAVFVGGWALQQVWLFVVAPTIGAVVAALTYQFVTRPEVLLTTAHAVSSLVSEQATREETAERITEAESVNR